MAFGGAMRDAVNKDNKRFDRVSILKETHDPTVAVVRRVLSNLKG
jgi:fructose-bisphosphate aldolase class II